MAKLLDDGDPMALDHSAYETLGTSPTSAAGLKQNAVEPLTVPSEYEEGFGAHPNMPNSPSWAKALDPREEPPKQGTVKSSIFNLVSTIVGGGVLSLPYAFKETGLVLGALILGLVAVMSAYSAHLLVACGRRCNAWAYDEIALVAFPNRGKEAKLFVSAMIFLLCSLAAVGYVILIGDLVTPVAVDLFAKGSFAAKRWVVQLGAVLVVFPFSLLKNLSSLRYNSFVSICSILFLAVGIVTRSVQSRFGEHCIEGAGKCPHWANVSDPTPPVNATLSGLANPVWFKIDGGCLVAFSIMACAFLCHFNVVPTQHDLRDPTRDRLNQTTQATMGIAYLLYVIVACFGYFEFRERSCDNVLKNYNPDNALITAGRCGLALCLLLSFPLLTHPARDSLCVLLFCGRKVDLLETNLVGYVALTMMLYTVFYLVGSNVTSIVTVWSFLGSTVAIMVGYIMPAYMYLKIREPNEFTASFVETARPSLSHSASGNAITLMDNVPDVPLLEGLTHRRRLPATLLLLAGVILMIACTTQAVLQVVQTGEKEPLWCRSGGD